MSLYPGTFWLGGYGWWGDPATAEVSAGKADAPVKPQKLLKRQQWYGGTADLWRQASRNNAPPGNYATYGLMAKHPTIAKAYGIIIHAILAGTRQLKIRTKSGDSRPFRPGGPVGEGVSVAPEDKKAQLLYDSFKPHWSYLLSSCGRSLQYGHSLMQMEWDRRKGATVISRFRRWRPGEVTLLTDEQTGDFAGFRYNQQDRDTRYAFNCVNQSDLDPLFGFANSENCREEWWEKVKAKIQGAALDIRATSIVPIVKGPAGDEGQQGAKNIAAALSRGEPVYMAQYPWDEEDMNPSINPDAAKYTAYDVDTVDLGDTGPAQDAILQKLGYLDVEMLAGWYLAPLQAAESKFGTRAQASVHADANTTYSELVHGSFLEQINAGPVRVHNRTNYGEDEVDRYFWEPDPLADPQQSFLQDYVKALATNPVSQALPMTDEMALLKRVEVPTKANYVAPPPLPTQPPDGALPEPTNGNGRMKQMLDANAE